MGADLYFTKKYKKNERTYKPLFDKAVNQRDASKDRQVRDIFQKEVERYADLMRSEGYFRDSYNSTSVLAQFNLSWWQDIIPMLDKKGNLTPAKCKEFLEILKANEAVFNENLEKFGRDAEFLEHCNHSGKDPKKERQEWIKYFMEKYLNLQRFLQEAIDTNESIDASL